MANTPALDLELVRTLIFIGEEGSFTRAGERIGRTQSAVSLQVQRLEALVGHTLVSRTKGGAVELTAHGKALAERGRTLLSMNDEIFDALRGQAEHSEVRLGVDEGFTRRCLPDILARFASTHPATSVDVWRASSCELVPRLKAGELDLMLCGSGVEPRNWPATEVWRGPLSWITSEAHAPHLLDPIPLALSPENCPFRPPWISECFWRSSALRALERIGRRHRIVSTSATIASQLAAVQAGLAITVSLPYALPDGLRPLRPDEGLPSLPDVALLLLKAREPRQPVTDAFASHILDSFEVKTHN